MHVAARKKINTYREQYAYNRNITFMPAITSTSSRMHGEFLRLLFLQAHRETTAHFTMAEHAADGKARSPTGLLRSARDLHFNIPTFQV